MSAIYTIGHSSRPIVAFLDLLRAHGIEMLVDIRTVPRSRHNPQFNTDQLPVSLTGAAIAYLHEPGLGGLRHPRKDSINLGWKNESFRGYADYMQTDEFRDHLDQVIALARERRIALMCAEAVPWRCHRSLVADVLVARGIPVYHIVSKVAAKPHTLTPFAQVAGDTVSYPPGLEQA